MKNLLYAPKEYWQLKPEIKAEICNGCGAAGKRDYIPDRLFGLDISECCNIHDYMYFCGNNLKDKRNADQAFLDNMLILIDTAGSGWFLRILRRWIALKYYGAVRNFGGPAFWHGKI